MTLKCTETSLPGVLLIEPKAFKDDRGFFLESYHRQKYLSTGMDQAFVQDNHSHSRRGTLRGLHYQLSKPQGKLVWALTGEIFDVSVDIRKSSPTFGRWFGMPLSQENSKAIYIPPHFAHGYCVVSDEAMVFYKCTDIC